MSRLTAAIGVLAIGLSACATSKVALLSGENGAPTGSVAVFDPKSGAEVGALTGAGTAASVRGSRKVRARSVDEGRYAALTAGLPPPPARYVLYFVEGSTTLVPDSEGELARMLDDVGRRSGVEVQIAGHTDTVGSSDDNDALSRQRAREIKEALVARGLNPGITRAVGRGERELLVPTDDNVPEPRNRRVEVTVR